MIMNMLRNLIFTVLTAALLASCAGEDGEIGPQGEQGEQGEQGDKGDTGDQGEQGEPGEYASKLGYFEGTVTGVRRDGTAFTEDFKYEFAFGNDAVEEGNYHLNRYETFAGAIAYSTTHLIPSIDKGYLLFTAQQRDGVWEPSDMVLGFEKALSSTSLFKLQARPYDEDVTFDLFIQLSPEANGKYKFSMVESGALYYADWDTDGDKALDAFQFQIFGTEKFLAYDYETGELLFVEESGDRVTEGALFDKYNEIKFVYIDDARANGFVKTSDGSALWEYIETVPGDQFTVTNFQKTDGVVSFDFTASVSKYRGYLKTNGPMGGWLGYGANTTMHDIQITGSFNSGGKVYDEIVSRKKQ